MYFSELTQILTYLTLVFKSFHVLDEWMTAGIFSIYGLFNFFLHLLYALAMPRCLCSTLQIRHVVFFVCHIFEHKDECHYALINYFIHTVLFLFDCYYKYFVVIGLRLSFNVIYELYTVKRYTNINKLLIIFFVFRIEFY